MTKTSHTGTEIARVYRIWWFSTYGLFSLCSCGSCRDSPINFEECCQVERTGPNINRVSFQISRLCHGKWTKLHSIYKFKYLRHVRMLHMMHVFWSEKNGCHNSYQYYGLRFLNVYGIILEHLFRKYKRQDTYM